MNVRACMTIDPVTVQPETLVKHALDLMLAHAVRHLPVVGAERRFIGIVREYDARAALVEGGDDAADLAVLEITEFRTPTFQGDESAQNAWAVLSRSPGHNPLPVVRDGKLEGTISQHDLLRALAGLPPTRAEGALSSAAVPPSPLTATTLPFRLRRQRHRPAMRDDEPRSSA